MSPSKSPATAPITLAKRKPTPTTPSRMAQRAGVRRDPHRVLAVLGLHRLQVLGDRRGRLVPGDALPLARAACADPLVRVLDAIAAVEVLELRHAAQADARRVRLRYGAAVDRRRRPTAPPRRASPCRRRRGRGGRRRRRSCWNARCARAARARPAWPRRPAAGHRGTCRRRACRRPPPHRRPRRSPPGRSGESGASPVAGRPPVRRRWLTRRRLTCAASPVESRLDMDAPAVAGRPACALRVLRSFPSTGRSMRFRAGPRRRRCDATPHGLSMVRPAVRSAVRRRTKGLGGRTPAFAPHASTAVTRHKRCGEPGPSSRDRLDQSQGEAASARSAATSSRTRTALGRASSQTRRRRFARPHTMMPEPRMPESADSGARKTAMSDEHLPNVLPRFRDGYPKVAAAPGRPRRVDRRGRSARQRHRRLVQARPSMGPPPRARSIQRAQGARRGATAEEIRHVALLGITTCGFPAGSPASLIDEVLAPYGARRGAGDG